MGRHLRNSAIALDHVSPRAHKGGRVLFLLVQVAHGDGRAGVRACCPSLWLTLVPTDFPGVFAPASLEIQREPWCFWIAPTWFDQGRGCFEMRSDCS